MIGAAFGVTGAAMDCLPPRRRSRRRAAMASVAARRSAHGGWASCAGACASLGVPGVATAVAPGAAARTVGRDAVAVAGGTIAGCGGVACSPTWRPERRVLGRCRGGLGAARDSVGRSARPCDRVERRLVCGGRATTVGAAPAGALPRASSVEGADSVGLGSTAAGAACGADITGAGAAAGGGAGRRGGRSVNGST
jgi:hypothetical protein